MANQSQEIIDHGVFPPLEAENQDQMSSNAIRSENIRFLPEHIELVRNKFVYLKLYYTDLNTVVFTKGYLLRYRWIIRILSALAIYLTIKFILFGLKLSGGIEQWNSAQWFNRGSLISFWGPVLLIIGALLAFIQSFIPSPILTITTNHTNYNIRIKNLEGNKTLNDLKNFLQEKGIHVLDKRKKKSN
jgi:hypothetical protein